MNVDISGVINSYNQSKIPKGVEMSKNDKLLKEQTDNFEALLLKTLLDVAMPMDNTLYPKEAGGDIYNSMYKDTLAQNLSGGFGYSELLYNFLKEQENLK